MLYYKLFIFALRINENNADILLISTEKLLQFQLKYRLIYFFHTFTLKKENINIFIFNFQLIPYKPDTHPVVDKPIPYLYGLVLRPSPPKARVWGGPSIFSNCQHKIFSRVLKLFSRFFVQKKADNSYFGVKKLFTALIT